MINLKNKKRIYAICSIAAILSLGLTACSNSENKNVANTNETSTQQKSSNNSTANSNLDNNNSKETNNQVKPTQKPNVNIPKFSKQELEKGSKPTFSTQWKASTNETFSACIEGKGEEAAEEGIGKIFVKDSNDKILSFEILNNNKISPRYIEWADDKNLLVIIGSAQGTVSKGGNLYLLDVSTGKVSLVMQTPDKKQQIMTAKRSGNNIGLKVNVYDDDAFNKSHVENWTIYSFDINLNTEMKVKSSDGKLIYVINGDN